MPKVSVIIPVYNSEKYLKECLDSVINQTLKDIEIICINDGSTDNSAAILEEYVEKYDFIKVYNQQNLGVSCARNKGIELSSGDYIFFMDSDDTIEDAFFANINKVIQENSSAELIIREDGWWFKNGIVDINSLDCIPTCAFLIKKSFLNSYSSIRFPVGIQPCEDGIFTHKILCLCKKSTTCKGAIYNYRKHELSSEYSVNSGVLSQQIPKWLDIISDFYDEFGLWKTKKQKLIKFLIHEPFGRFNSQKYNYSKTQKEFLFNYIKKILKKAKINSKDDFQSNKDFRFFVCSKNYSSFVVKKSCVKCCRWLFSITNENHCNRKHKVICFLGVKLKIKRSKFLKTKQSVIVSLTSYPVRINTVYKTIESLLEQTFKADKIVLNLGEDKFPNKENDLPRELLDLIPMGLEINWCKDIRSYTKLLPALRKYPNSIIITVDDDLIYPKHLLRKLVWAYIKNPEYIHCHRAHLILFDKKGKIKPYEQWSKETSGVKPSFNNFLTGVGGVLYPPNVFYEEVFNEEKFKRLAPMADDIWFWAMAVLNGTKINVIKNNISNLEYIEGTQENGLYATNITKNDEQLQNVLHEYPEILKKLKRIKSYDSLTFWQKFFSIRNTYRHGVKHKILRIFGLKFSFNIDKLLFILKPKKNISVRKNSILLVEVNDNDHAEVLPGYAKYLLDLGYNVDVVLTENNYKMNSLCRIKDENLRIYPIKKYFLGEFFNSSIIKKYSKIFFASHITYYSIGELSFTKYKPRGEKYVTIFEHFPVLNKYKNKIYTVEHHLDLVDKELLKNKQVISLVKFDMQDKNFAMVNPNYFGEIKITGKNEKITKFITIGTFFAFRRNTELLAKTVKLLKEQGFSNFEICAIGRYKSQDFSSDDFKHVNFLGRTSADIVYDKMEEADFFLPMLDPENADHDRYITIGTSGSFQLIYGFNKPCLIAEKFAKPHHFNENNSIIYKTNDDFIEAMKLAISMDSKDYDMMQKYLADTASEIRTESMQNLKEMLKS